MHEYSAVIEVWYSAEDQEDAKILAKMYGTVIGKLDNVNQVDINEQPEEQWQILK